MQTVDMMVNYKYCLSAANIHIHVICMAGLKAMHFSDMHDSEKMLLRQNKSGVERSAKQYLTE